MCSSVGLRMLRWEVGLHTSTSVGLRGDADMVISLEHNLCKTIRKNVFLWFSAMFWPMPFPLLILSFHQYRSTARKEPLSFELFGGGVKKTVNWTFSVDSIFQTVPNMFKFLDPVLWNSLCPAQLLWLIWHVFTVFMFRGFISQATQEVRPTRQMKVHLFTGSLPVVCTCLALVTRVPTPSGCLFVWMALQFVKFNTVQLFKPLLTELAGVVVVGLWSVFLHVPVEGGTLATLIATDFTSNRRCEQDRKRKKVMVMIMLLSIFFYSLMSRFFLNFSKSAWWTNSGPLTVH